MNFQRNKNSTLQNSLPLKICKGYRRSRRVSSLGRVVLVYPRDTIKRPIQIAEREKGIVLKTGLIISETVHP